MGWLPGAVTRHLGSSGCGASWRRRRGGGKMTVRLVVGVVLVTIISMSLQVPEVGLSAYMVFFVTSRIVCSRRSPAWC